MQFFYVKLNWYCKLCLNSQKYSMKSSDRASLNKNYTSDYILDKTNDNNTCNQLQQTNKSDINFQRKPIKKQNSLHEHGTNSNEFDNSELFYLADIKNTSLPREKSNENLNDSNNLIKSNTKSNQSIKNHNHVIQSNIIENNNNNTNNNIQIINKRHVNVQISHADSLSSDPSEHNTIESYPNLNESTTNLSSKHNNNISSLITINNHNNSLKKTKLIKKHKNKQCSFSSDDEDEEIFSTGIFEKLSF
jgi:hypothetical protein